MPSRSSFSRRHRPPRNGGFQICKRSGNTELGLRTGIEPADDSKLAPHKLGALLHAGQTMVSGAPAFLENLRVDALAVVPDPQPKLPFGILDFHFDAPCLCVQECVAHRLTGNPVDFVPDERSKIPGLALHLHTKFGTIRAG